MKKVTAWSINVVWEDGEEEILTDVPNYVAEAVDSHMTLLEELTAEEVRRKDD